MKVTYVSPVFRNEDGTAKRFLIPLAALSTYRTRDGALLKMLDLGGIHAKSTPETKKLMATIRRAKNKIAKEGWFSIGTSGL